MISPIMKTLYCTYWYWYGWYIGLCPGIGGWWYSGGGGWYPWLGGCGGACGNCCMFINTFCWCSPLLGCNLETCCASCCIGKPVSVSKGFWLDVVVSACELYTCCNERDQLKIFSPNKPDHSSFKLMQVIQIRGYWHLPVFCNFEYLYFHYKKNSVFSHCLQNWTQTNFHPNALTRAPLFLSSSLSSDMNSLSLLVKPKSFTLSLLPPNKDSKFPSSFSVFSGSLNGSSREGVAHKLLSSHCSLLYVADSCVPLLGPNSITSGLFGSSLRLSPELL